MFGVLEIVFRSDRIPARVRVARQLKIFFRDMVGIAANLHVGAVRFVRTRQRIGPATIVRRTPPHPLLILTRSHLEFLECTSAISLQLGTPSERTYATLSRGLASPRRFRPPNTYTHMLGLTCRFFVFPRPPLPAGGLTIVRKIGCRSLSSLPNRPSSTTTA